MPGQGFPEVLGVSCLGKKGYKIIGAEPGTIRDWGNWPEKRGVGISKWEETDVLRNDKTKERD